MRRFWIALLVVGLIAGGAAAGAYAQSAYRQQIEVEYKGIKIAVDGRTVATPDEPFVYVEKGRTFVPARPLAEALGARVGWDADTNTVQVYTKSYVTSAVTDTGILWTHPWGGFTLKAPPTYFRIDMPFALVQLVKPLPTGNALVAVQQWGPTGAKQVQIDEVLSALKTAALLSDVKLDTVLDARDHVMYRGTGNFMGTGEVALSLEIRSAAGADWVLLGLVPTASAETLRPEIEGILESFSLK